ncbi:MAG TPA: hypothetical protein VNM22_01820 [Candidatus Limnocylindrales bacterium]|nr:hypothetical protein [Candidatus Limnocylindrales bacterium]
MKNSKPFNQTRREFLQACFTIPAIGAMVLHDGLEVIAQTQELPPTPACGDEEDLTPSNAEGPFFKPKSPRRTSLLEPGITGTKLIVTGYVLSTDCKPITGALLDFWHADAKGVYDNVGYKLRGHQFSDEAGRYHLETIVPGLYPGRTRHIHVKVQAPNKPILTTQLYFPGEQLNQTDFIFRPELLMKVQDSNEGKTATFNFVLDVS